MGGHPVDPHVPAEAKLAVFLLLLGSTLSSAIGARHPRYRAMAVGAIAITQGTLGTLIVVYGLIAGDSPILAVKRGLVYLLAATLAYALKNVYSRYRETLSSIKKKQILDVIHDGGVVTHE